jgi:TPP-dependent 2-oxoacid decarboxylase
VENIERELRAGRPQLDPALEQSLVAGVGAPRRTNRPLIAVVMTTAAVGALSLFGGVGYAFSNHGSSLHGWTGGAIADGCSGQHNHHTNQQHHYSGNHHHHSNHHHHHSY